MTRPARAVAPQVMAAAAVAAAITLTAALAACGGGNGGDPAAHRPPIETTTAPGATTTAPGHGTGAKATTTTTPRTPGQLAVAAYQASWDATFRALNPPRQLPELGRLMTGDALSETTNEIAIVARKGHHVTGSMTTHPRVVSATATEVILDDCTVENSMEYDAANKPVDPANGVRTSFRVTVDNVGGTWKVAHFERRNAPCDPG